MPTKVRWRKPNFPDSMVISHFAAIGMDFRAKSYVTMVDLNFWNCTEYMRLHRLLQMKQFPPWCQENP